MSQIRLPGPLGGRIPDASRTWTEQAVQQLARELWGHPALQMPALWAPREAAVHAAVIAAELSIADGTSPSASDALRYTCMARTEGAGPVDPAVHIQQEVARLERVVADLRDRLIQKGDSVQTLEEAYVRRVLDTLARYRDEAATSPPLCCIAVLEALIVMPPHIFLSDDLHRWRVTQIDGLPVVELVRRLLRCMENGQITALTGPEVERLYRATRPTRHTSALFLSLLYQCRNRVDLLACLDFVEWHEALSSEEQCCFWRYADSCHGQWNVDRAIRLADIHSGVSANYVMANRCEQIAARLCRVRESGADTLLLRLGLPIAEQSLVTCESDSVPLPLRMLVSALELSAQWSEAVVIAQCSEAILTKDERAQRILADLNLLGSPCDQPFSAQSREDLDVHTLAGVAEPVRTVAMLRLCAEADHSIWQIRYWVVTNITACLNAGAAALPQYQSVCTSMVDDSSPWVRLRALEALVLGLQQAAPAERVRLWRRLPFVRVLRDLMLDADRDCVVEAIALCQRVWSLLPPATRDGVSRLLWQLVCRRYAEASSEEGGTEWRMEGTEDIDEFLDFLNEDVEEPTAQSTPLVISLTAAAVLCRHAESIPIGISTRLRTQRQLSRLIARGLTAEKESRQLSEAVLVAYLPLGFSPEFFNDVMRQIPKMTNPRLNPLAHYEMEQAELILYDRCFCHLMTSTAPEQRTAVAQDALKILLPGLFVLSDNMIDRTSVALRRILGLVLPQDRLAMLTRLRALRQAQTERAVRVDHAALINSRFALFLINAVSDIPEWQSVVLLPDFECLIGADRAAQWTTLAAGLPRRDYPLFYRTLRNAYVGEESRYQLVRYLLDSVHTLEQSRNIFSFIREWAGLPLAIQDAFADAVAEESRRTVSGQGKPVVDATAPVPWRLNPAKALQRLRSWLIGRFVESLDQLASHHKAQLRSDLQARAKLWQHGNLLQHLASLASFSDRHGKAAIVGLVRQLQSDVSRRATTDVGDCRLMNPQRYDHLSEALAPAFIDRWSNGGNDRVIALGQLGAAVALRTDPQVLLRSKYDYAARQMANHLDVPGVSHLDGGALYAAIDRQLARADVEAVPGGRQWVRQASSVLRRMAQEETIAENELEVLQDTLRTHPELGRVFGPGGPELLNDLLQLKLSLPAEAVSGTAWLIITDNPADMVGAGRDPTTCQDPTRNTGHNTAGQPVNRARDGKFLYAKVVVADQVTLQNGVAVVSPDGEVVARTHLEVTTATGRPDPSAEPHVLGERAYVHPGFIYKDQLAAGLNQWVRDGLQLDPERQAHWQFVSHGMRSVPPHLPDRDRIYRDTFR